MFWRTSSNDLETRYYKTRIRSQYHEHVNQKSWAISEFPLISSDQNYIPMRKKIYSVFIRNGCASGEVLRGKREHGNRSFFSEITFFLNLRTRSSSSSSSSSSPLEKFKFKFKFIYSHLFHCNTTTIRKQKEVKTEL